jgi:hypothetical protein
MHKIFLLQEIIESHPTLKKLLDVNSEKLLFRTRPKRQRQVAHSGDIDNLTIITQPPPVAKATTSVVKQAAGSDQEILITKNAAQASTHKVRTKPFLAVSMDRLCSCFMRPKYAYSDEHVERTFAQYRLPSFRKEYQIFAVVLALSALAQPYFDIVTYCDDQLANKSPSLCQRNGDPDTYTTILLWRFAGSGVTSTVFAIASFTKGLQGSMKIMQWMATANSVLQSIILWYALALSLCFFVWHICIGFIEC